MLGHKWSDEDVHSTCIHCGENIEPRFYTRAGHIRFWVHVFYGVSGAGTDHESLVVGDEDYRCSLYATPPSDLDQGEE